LGLNRSGLYYKHTDDVTQKDVHIMNEIRNIHAQYPFYGYRKIHAILRANDNAHNRKKIQRLMHIAGLKAICPYKKRNASKSKPHKIYPYLLKDIVMDRPNKAWQVDITYIKLKKGFVYLVCLIDIYSRRIMGWNLSPFLDTDSCIVALESSLAHAIPDIINSDQGCQFTSDVWCNKLSNAGIKISMDGKGRWADNVYIERLWRTIKYELIHLYCFESVHKLRLALANYITFYNAERPHQSLDYMLPNNVYKGLEICK
jgi:putative transposase